MLPHPSIPVGGGSGCSHDHSAAIDECARFLASVPPAERPRPLVPAMKQMFGLTAAEVCAAIKDSHGLGYGGAHGTA